MARTGERKNQILQTLAQMLENPASEKVTTAALAAKLDVSEAALYRHFSGKAQMFEGLIEFIEQTLFALINKITTEEKSGLRQIDAIVGVLLAFAQKNKGMTRVLIGDALVHETSGCRRVSISYMTGSRPRSSRRCDSASRRTSSCRIPTPRCAPTWS